MFDRVLNMSMFRANSLYKGFGLKSGKMEDLKGASRALSKNGAIANCQRFFRNSEKNYFSKGPCSASSVFALDKKLCCN